MYGGEGWSGAPGSGSFLERVGMSRPEGRAGAGGVSGSSLLDAIAAHVEITFPFLQMLVNRCGCVFRSSMTA